MDVREMQLESELRSMWKRNVFLPVLPDGSCDPEPMRELERDYAAKRDELADIRLLRLENAERKRVAATGIDTPTALSEGAL